jgi:hypothetical protein
MLLVAQRVVQLGSILRAGINAFCYLHGELSWLDEPPADLGSGELANYALEVDPRTVNRVRSYLDIIAPDATSNQRLVAAVQSGADTLASAGRPPPWHLAHGEVAFSFEVEAALAAHWQVEMRMLLGYALAVRVAAADISFSDGNV